MGLWERLRTHAHVVTYVCSAAATVLAIAALVHTPTFRFELGNVAEWLAAIGSFAAFGALLFAAREWRSGQEERRSLETERQKVDQERRDLAAARDAERRDHEMSQSRLVIVEHPPFESRSWGGDDPPHPSQRDAIIRNYSAAPVFHLHIEEHLTDNDDVRVWENFAQHRGRPADWTVLAAGEPTGVLTVVGNRGDTPSTEFVEFTFTDSRGARWRRVGTSQPVQLLDAEP
jgi:hypothetical protein